MITNGTFDTDLSGWATIASATTASGNADIKWEYGRARLEVYQCAFATLKQTFTIDNSILRFNYRFGHDIGGIANIAFELIVDGTTIPIPTTEYSITLIYGIVETFGIGTLDVSSHIGKSAIVRFRLYPKEDCYYWYNNHTYLWIDDVKLRWPISNTGAAFFDSSAHRARILIDGVDTGKVTPAFISDLTEGIHTYRLLLDGHDEYVDNVNVIAGQMSSVSATLTKTTIYAGITNGLFDTDLSGWDIRAYGNKADVTWEDGTARVMNHQCAYAELIQTFIINNPILRFDFLYSAFIDGDMWPMGDTIVFELIVDGTTTTIPTTNITISPNIYNWPYHVGYGILDVSLYIGMTATIICKIYPDSFCNNRDHYYTSVWIGNILLLPQITDKGFVELLASRSMRKMMGGTVTSVDHVSLKTKIYINDVDIGQSTPSTIILDPGTYTYRVTLDDYYDYTGTVNVSSGNTALIHAPLTRVTGDLFMSSIPSGAIIYVDDINTGKVTQDTVFKTLPGTHVPILPGSYTSMSGSRMYVDYIDSGIATNRDFPEMVNKLAPGTHTYRVTTPGYYDYTGTFDIIENEIIQVTITLSQPGTLDISSTPSGAEIYIDDVDQVVTTPATISNLTPGTHTYKLTLPGYYDSTGTFDIISGQTTTLEFIVFTLITGDLNISSTPAGARIYIDDVDQGIVAPNAITGLIPGIHTYKLTLTGYYDTTGSFSIIGEQTTSVSGTLVLIVGVLDISSTPPGARIYIDNIDTGQITPNTISNLTPGTHTYKLTLPGYYDSTGTFSIIAEQTTTLEFIVFTLITGDLNISSTPAGARIYIDDVDQGIVTPASIPGLIPGTHTYKLTLTGYYDTTGSFSIIGGQTTPVSGTLVLIVGVLDISSTPPGARIYIDNVDQGIVTPASIPGLIPGTHTYKLTLYEYQDATGSFNITGGEITLLPVTLIATLGHIDISSTPAGAEIFIDGTDQGIVTPNVMTGLTPGMHTYRLTLAGYYDATGPFSITAGETTVTTEILVPSVGSLDISSTPSGAEIFIDDIDQGITTPYIIPNISEGSHTYKLTLAGYYDVTGSFSIIGGQTTIIPTQVLVPSVGSLDISSTPSGAEIFIDDIDQGITTPYIIPNISEGSHTYKLTLAGYYDVTGSFSIIGGQTTTIAETLTQIPGTLDISSIPPGAEIFIDGVDQLTTTPYSTSLLPGNYEIVLTLANYVDRTITVTILPGQTTTISTTLFPTTDLLTDIRCGSPKFHINYSNTGQSIYPSYTDGTIKWTYPTTGQVRGSPAIDIDRTIYMGDSNGNFYAINPDGTLKWQSLKGGSSYSSPIIGNDGTIYTFGEDPTIWTYGLYAFNPDGTIKWNSDIGGYSETAPAIGLDGNIYVGTGNGFLYAFDLTDGSQVWLNDMFTNADNNCPAVSPLDGTIYAKVFDGTYLYLCAFDPINGDIIWYTYIGDAWPRSQSPSIAGDGTIYMAAADGGICYLYAINPVDGSINWQYRIGIQQTESYPAIAADGTTYIGNGDYENYRMYAINPNGTLKWYYPVRDEPRSPPTIDLAGNIYFGTDGVYDPILGYNIARFYSLNPDGTLRWYKDVPTNNSIVSSPSIAPDGTIYVGTDSHWDPTLAIGLVAFQSTYVAPPSQCTTVIKHEGDTITLKATPKDGVGPYNVRFEKNGVLIPSLRLQDQPNPITDAPEDTLITRIYTLNDEDIRTALLGTIDFSVIIQDSCPSPLGPKTCTDICTITLGCIAPICNFTVT